MARSHYFLRNVTSDLGGGADFNKLLSTTQGVVGTLLSVTIAPSSTETSYGFTEPGDPGRRGSVRVTDYTVKVSVKTAGNLTLKIRLHRINSLGEVQSSSVESASQSLNSIGVKRYNFSAVDLDIFKGTDRLRVDYAFNNATGGNETVEIEYDGTLDTEADVPWNPGLLSGPERLVLDTSYIVGIWCVEIDTPDGMISGSLHTSGNISGIGGYPEKITSMSEIPLGIPARKPGLEIPEVILEWDDSDRSFGAIVEGENGDDLIGSPSRIKLILQGDNPISILISSGILRGFQPLPLELKWKLKLGPDSRKITGLIPRVRIAKSDFPNATSEFLDKPVPQVYGIWDSLGSTNNGSLPCLLVDNLNYRYLVSHGSVNKIIRVYKNGQVVDASLWTRFDYTINGRDYTLIEFTDDQMDATITADIEGYQIGGSVIERPSVILQHWFSNFVEGNYQGGAFNTGIPSGFNPGTVLLDYEEPFDFIGALYINTFRKPVDVINDLLTSWFYRGWYGRNGKIRIGPYDHRPIVTYTDGSWVRGLGDELGDLTPNYEHRDLLDRVKVSYLQDIVAGGFVRSLEVIDPRKNTIVTDQFQMLWGAARIL